MPLKLFEQRNNKNFDPSASNGCHHGYGSQDIGPRDKNMSLAFVGIFVALFCELKTLIDVLNLLKHIISLLIIRMFT